MFPGYTKCERNQMRIGDEELMTMFAAGVSEAFDMLYERYKHRIYRFAAASLRSMSCAEEVVQDVFMRLASAAPTYQPRGKFTAWLFTIAVGHLPWRNA